MERLDFPTEFLTIDRIRLFKLGEYIWDRIANFELDFEVNEINIGQTKTDTATSLIMRFNLNSNTNTWNSNHLQCRFFEKRNY